MRNDDTIVIEVFNRIMNERHAVPIFIDGLSKEKQIVKVGQYLPLMYCWVRKRLGKKEGVISFNGNIVKDFIEDECGELPVNHVELRETVLNMLRESSEKTLISTLEKTGASLDILCEAISGKRGKVWRDGTVRYSLISAGAPPSYKL